MMLSRQSLVKMFVEASICHLFLSEVSSILQTLRFVQSLPKRERVPFKEKLRCTDETG